MLPVAIVNGMGTEPNDRHTGDAVRDEGTGQGYIAVANCITADATGCDGIANQAVAQGLSRIPEARGQNAG